MTPEQLNATYEAINKLALDELADLIIHLGDGTLAEIKDEPWGHHITPILPAADDTDGINALWILLIEIQGRRFSQRRRQEQTRFVCGND